jgi:hypothetical protein
MTGLFPIDYIDQLARETDNYRNTFKIMSKDDFDNLVKTNPFNKWGCPYGVSDEELKQFQRENLPVKKTSVKNSKKTKRSKKN